MEVELDTGRAKFEEVDNWDMIYYIAKYEDGYSDIVYYKCYVIWDKILKRWCIIYE